MTLCSCRGGLFYPMHFRGEGKTNVGWQIGGFKFYPMHFRGEGKTPSAD